MVKTLKIGIAGAGIGGPCAGTLLSRQGHDITIFDQFERPSPVGSGLVLQPVGLSVLRTVGIFEKVAEMGAPLSHLIGHEVRSGWRVLNAAYGATPGLGIHRAALFEALYDAATQAGCQLRVSAEVTGSHLQDNQRFVTLNGQDTVGPFDLLIDATGAGSTLSPIRRRDLPFGALWGTVDWPQDTAISDSHLTQKYRRSSIMIGVLPIGSLPGSTGKKAAIFWSIPQADHAKWRDTELQLWKDQITGLWPEFAPFLQQITRHDQMTMARYSHGTLLRPFAEKLVFIGDAAHCASPQLGQGANMALLDALALATALDQHPVDVALPRYAASRRRHILLYQTLSRVFTQMYQSANPAMPLIRDWLLAPLTFLPPVPWILRHLIGGRLVTPIRGVRLEQADAKAAPKNDRFY